MKYRIWLSLSLLVLLCAFVSTILDQWYPPTQSYRLIRWLIGVAAWVSLMFANLALTRYESRQSQKRLEELVKRVKKGDL